MIIRGIRGAKINNEIFNLGLKFQILSANLVATKKHVLHAINQAKTKKPIARNFWMEILVRASGQRQIHEAIKIIGAKDGDVCLICEDEDTFRKIHELIGGEIDDSVLEINEEKERLIREVFKIRGFGDVVERVLEKIALIELKKE